MGIGQRPDHPIFFVRDWYTFLQHYVKLLKLSKQRIYRFYGKIGPYSESLKKNGLDTIVKKFIIDILDRVVVI